MGRLLDISRPPARVPYKGKQAAGPKIGRISKKFCIPYKKGIKKTIANYIFFDFLARYLCPQKQQNNIMKATTFIHAIAAHNWDTIPAQIMHILDRHDLSKVIGTEGKIYAIGMNGIPESNYLYLYPDADQMQADFYNALQEAGQTWENNPNIVDAVCTDAAGQLIVIINVMEG